MKLFLLTVLSIMLAGAVQAAGSGVTPQTRIDELVAEGLKAQKLTPNEPASDEVFVRRIYLDIVGRIPTREESLNFLNSEQADKRDQLIDELLNSDGYVSNFYHFWADLLRARTAITGINLSSGTGRAYENWIKTALRENKPYDEMVRELVTATGHSWENGAVGYYIRDYGMPLDSTAMTAQVFLGTQIVCAQCHNHPFDKWTQMDYYHLAAFTYGMTTTNQLPGRPKGGMPEKMNQKKQKELRRAFSEILKPVRFNNVVETNRLPKLPHDYQYDDAKPKSSVKPAAIMGNEAVISPSKPTSESFAEWLTSPQNPRFTLVMANRLWKKAFGLGLIEPVDNMKDHTSASNPQLMAYLEELLKEKNYDMKAYLAAIYKSKTYQREATTEEIPTGTPYYFQGPILRRMSAEQAWDSIVALIRENPDRPDAEWELEGKEEILRRQMVGEAVYNQNPKQYLRNGIEVLSIQKHLSLQIDAAVEKLTAARETNDLQKIREASTEVRDARRALANSIEQKVYLGGLRDAIEVASADTGKADSPSDEFFQDLIATATAQGNGDVMSGMDAIINEKGGVIRQLVRAMMADENDVLQKKKVAEALQEMEDWNITKKNRKIYNTFKKVSQDMVRASDLPSPAPGGHFLREFGQSDRELIDNANDQASVTQALTMLNGNVAFAVSNPFSVFSRGMKEGANFKERLDNVYLTMFSRPASKTEREIFTEAWKSDPESATNSGIAWTLLNTRQFLFIN